MTSGPETPAGLVPAWLRELAAAAETMETFPQLVPPATGGRASAVLILFGDGPGGPDLLLIQRSEELRLHAGQPAFPGGAIDAGDGGPVGAVRPVAEQDEHRRLPAAGGGRGELRVHLHRGGHAR